MEDEDWEENPFENRPITKKGSERREKDRSLSAEKESFEASVERRPPPRRTVAPTAPPEEENPFETRSETPLAPAVEDELNPFENIPSDVGYGDEEVLDYDEFDKSKLSFVSGIGFVTLGFILYFFVIVPEVPNLLTFSVMAIIFSTVVAFFYLLDDLKIRTTKLTERGARFLSGIFFMVLVILFIVALMTYWPSISNMDLTSPIVLVVVIVLTNASVALFLYSMLWEE
ncbi:MAG: hypothetical protein E3J35_02980 [Methanomassiliicoccales archaeon]|nr:MAG: hypothetical protein E3J35_02980 [Methanomassiliicoccales archaeon]